MYYNVHACECLGHPYLQSTNYDENVQAIPTYKSLITLIHATGKAQTYDLKY